MTWSRTWSDEQLVTLHRLCGEGARAAQLVEEIGKGPDSVRRKAAALGLKIAPTPTGPSVNTAWTEDRVADLRRLAGEGLSAGQIAAALGFSSRGSISGKASRLGLTLTGGNGAPEADPSAKARRASERATRPRTTVGLEPKAAILAPATPPAIPGQFAKPFGERTRHQCSWPIEDGTELLSCCAKVVRGSFCAEHAEIGLKPPSTDRQRKRAASSFFYHAGYTRGRGAIGKVGGALAE